MNRRRGFFSFFENWLDVPSIQMTGFNMTMIRRAKLRNIKRNRKGKR